MKMECIGHCLSYLYAVLTLVCLKQNKFRFTICWTVATRDFHGIYQGGVRCLTNVWTCSNSPIVAMQDVGQSILESYSRVLESLAFTIIARIDDVLYADDLVKRSLGSQSLAQDGSMSRRIGFSSRRARSTGSKRYAALSTTYATPSISPIYSPAVSPLALRKTPNSPHEGPILVPSLGNALSDYTCRNIPEGEALLETEGSHKLALDGARPWTYAGHLEISNALHSPPGRD